MGGARARRLDRSGCDLARLALAAQPGGEDEAQQGAALQPAHHVGRNLALGVQREDVAQQVGRKYPGAAQSGAALDDQRQRDDRGENQRPDWPANGLNNGEQGGASDSRTDAAAPAACPMKTRSLLSDLTPPRPANPSGPPARRLWIDLWTNRLSCAWAKAEWLPGSVASLRRTFKKY